MKFLVIYDSTHGNTKKIAETIAARLGKSTEVVTAADFKPADLQNVTHLVVGSPIIGWKPAERMAAFLAELKPGQLNGLQAAAFDTRVKLFIHGDAVGKIGAALQRAGARLFAEPCFFYVKGSEGPLFEGEIERATQWAEALIKAAI